MNRLTFLILCTVGLFTASVRSEAQTAPLAQAPAFVDADGDGINDTNQGIRRALGRMKGGARFDWSATLPKVKLTVTQQARLERVFMDHQMSIFSLNAALDAAQVRLREARRWAQPDRKMIDAQIDAITNARLQLQKATAVYQLAVQSILTPEQWAALSAATQDAKANAPGTMGNGARKRGEDVFVDEDGDGITDGRRIGRKPAGMGDPGHRGHMGR